MGSTGKCSQIRWPILLELNWNNLHFIFSLGLTFKRKICQLPKWDLKRLCLKEKQKWNTENLLDFFIPPLQKKLFSTSLSLGDDTLLTETFFWPLWAILLWASDAEDSLSGNVVSSCPSSPAEPVTSTNAGSSKRHLFGLNHSLQTYASSPDHWEAFAIQVHCLLSSHVVLPSVNSERSEFQPESFMKGQ